MGLFSSIGDAIGDVTSALSPVSDIVGAGLSLLGTNMTNSASAASVQQQEAFQEDASNTAYQRATADMKAAGLNSMLAYTQGGASTPSGSTYVPQNPLSNAVSAYNTTKTSSSQAALQNAQTASTSTQASLNTALTNKANQDAKLSAASAASVSAGLPQKQVTSDFYNAIGGATHSASGAIRDSATASSIRSLFDTSPSRSPTIDDLRSVINDPANQ